MKLTPMLEQYLRAKQDVGDALLFFRLGDFYELFFEDATTAEKTAAKADIQQEASRAREQLREQVAALAVAGAEKILRREVDAKAHADLLDGIKKQL